MSTASMILLLFVSKSKQLLGNKIMMARTTGTDVSLDVEETKHILVQLETLSNLIKAIPSNWLRATLGGAKAPPIKYVGWKAERGHFLQINGKWHREEPYGRDELA